MLRHQQNFVAGPDDPQTFGSVVRSRFELDGDDADAPPPPGLEIFREHALAVPPLGDHEHERLLVSLFPGRHDAHVHEPISLLQLHGLDPAAGAPGGPQVGHSKPRGQPPGRSQQHVVRLLGQVAPPEHVPLLQGGDDEPPGGDLGEGVQGGPLDPPPLGGQHDAFSGFGKVRHGQDGGGLLPPSHGEDGGEGRPPGGAGELGDAVGADSEGDASLGDDQEGVMVVAGEAVGHVGGGGVEVVGGGGGGVGAAFAAGAAVLGFEGGQGHAFDVAAVGHHDDGPRILHEIFFHHLGVISLGQDDGPSRHAMSFFDLGHFIFHDFSHAVVVGHEIFQ
mmetsp:Transcript_24506/g.55983  ORF Transcript_24506/g.55983 Transcript_24506/m.55983 type:complete len:334 (-) Transcript_24506:799-1800(-)